MKRGILLSIFAMLILANTARAEMNEPSYDRDTEMITVSGSVGAPSSPIAIEVLRPGYTWDEISDEDIEYDKLAYFAPLLSDGNGEFSITFKINGEAGIYPIRAYSLSEREYFNNDTLRIFTKKDIENLIKRIGEASTEQEIGIVFDEDNAEMLGIDISKFQSLDADNQKSMILNVLNEKSETSINGVSDICSVIDRAFLLLDINNCKSGQELIKIIEENGDMIALDDDHSYNLYSNSNIYADARKQLMLSSLINKGYKTISGFRDSFADAAVLYACYSQENYKIVEAALSDSLVLKKYDLGSFGSLKDKTVVYKELNKMKSPVADVSALAQKIKTLADTGDKTGSSNSGGGSGGASGGGTVYTVQPDVKTNTGNSTQPARNEFTDMSGYEWAKQAVETLRNAGIVNGRTPNAFCPDDKVTREEFVKMLTGLFEIKADDTNLGFDDVAEGAWYYSAVSGAASAGIVSGVSEREFGVGMHITRQDMAVMIFRAMNSQGMTVEASDGMVFNDEEEIAPYAIKSVKGLTSIGIVNGMGDGNFMPDAELNRASAAQVIYNIYTRRNGDE